MNPHSFTRACAVLMLTALLSAQAALAALSVSPMRVVLEGRPGQKLAGTFQVVNAGSEPMEALVEPEDWSGGMSGSRGSVPWMVVKPKRFKLKPGQGRRVSYTIRVPNDAKGELRTQVFFSSADEGEGIRSRLGAIVYVTIQGTQAVAASLGEVHAYYAPSTPGIQKPDRLEIVLSIQNQSNVHLIPEGQVLVKDAQGMTVATALLPPGWALLPSEEDRYHAIAGGVYLKPGRYTLAVTIRGGDDVQQPITLEKTLSATLSPDFQWILEEPPAPTP